MAMRWSRWVVTLPPPGAPPPITSSQSGPACDNTPLAVSPAWIAARRSLSLTRNSAKPFHARRALGKGRGNGKNGEFVDHRGRAMGRHPHRLEPRGLDRKIAHLLAARQPPVMDFDMRAHFEKRLDEAEPGRVEHDVFDGERRAGGDQGRDQRKGGGRRIAGNGDVLALELVLAFDRDMPAIGAVFARNLGAEGLQHALGVIARRDRLDDRGAARAY